MKKIKGIDNNKDDKEKSELERNEIGRGRKGSSKNRRSRNEETDINKRISEKQEAGRNLKNVNKKYWRSLMENRKKKQKINSWTMDVKYNDTRRKWKKNVDLK